MPVETHCTYHNAGKIHGFTESGIDNCQSNKGLLYSYAQTVAKNRSTIHKTGNLQSSALLSEKTTKRPHATCTEDLV